MDRYDYVKELSDEKRDLDEKIEKLQVFIKTDHQDKDSYCPLRLLTAQLDLMRKYSLVLYERICCATV